MDQQKPAGTPVFIRRGRLAAELNALRFERKGLPESGAAVRKMQIGTRMNAIRAELAGLAAPVAPVVAVEPVQMPADPQVSAPADLPRADDETDDAPPADEAIGSARNPSAHLYNFDPNRKPAQRRRENAAAIALIAQVKAGEVDGAALTQEQKAILAKYSGTGGNLIGADGKAGSAYEYYTPKPVAEGCWELAKQLGFSGGKVLDPCAGVGVFGGTAPSVAVVDAVELNETSGTVNALVNNGPGYHCVVSNFEKVAASTPDETHDLVISNVPFGDNADRGRNCFDDPKYQKESLEAYFILRSLEKLKPGGLAMFIVPIRCVSGKTAKDESLRVRASELAEFMGAYRLPSHLFLTAGTETVTDVMVFRKHGRQALDKITELREQNPALLAQANVLWPEFIGGGYFKGEGRRYILGEESEKRGNFNSIVPLVLSDKSAADVGKLLQKFHVTTRIDWDLLDASETQPIAYEEGDTLSQAGQMLQLRGGEWVPIRTVDDSQQAAAMHESLQYPMTAFSAGVTWQQARDYMAFATRMSTTGSLPSWFRSAMAGLAKLSTESDRAKFWTAGVVALSAQQAFEFHQGTEVGFNYLAEYPDLSAAMKRVAGDAGSLPVLVGDPIKGATAVLRAHYTRKNGYSGVWQGNVMARKDDLRDDGQKFEAAKYRAAGSWVGIDQAKAIYGADFDPMADNDWCISADGKSVAKADDYFIGNYGDMLAKMKAEAAAATDEAIRNKLLAQMAVAHSRVQRVDPTGITFNLFSPFVTIEEKCEFLQRYFAKGVGQFSVVFDEETGKPTIDFSTSKSIDDDAATEEHKKLLKRMAVYMKNGTVTLGGIKVEDERKALERLRVMIATGNEQFDGWAKTNPGVTERLAEKANDPSRLYFRQVADHSPLPLPGWRLGSPPAGVTPHGYQYSFVRQQGRSFGGINGYSVGLGKSFTALAAVLHVQNIGVKKKTAIIVPNSVLSNWRKEAMVAYESMDDCLFVGMTIGKDGTPSVKSSDYDRDLNIIAENRHGKIFMTYEAFSRLRLRTGTIDAYVAHLRSVDSAFAESESKKDDEKASGKAARLEDALADGKSPAAPFLEDLGIDSLVMDEAHIAKNSAQSSSFQSAKYLSLASTSSIGNDLQAKAWFVRGMSPAKDGVLLLTATPITNSPLEVYSMLSLAAGRDRVNDMVLGVSGADKFLETVCVVESEEDESMDGVMRDNRIFKGLQNVDLLRNALGAIATIETPESVGMAIKVPEADEVATSVPLPDPPVLELLKQYKGAFRWAIDDTFGVDPNRGDIDAFEMVSAKFGEPTALIGHPFNLLRKMTAVILDPELDQRATFYTISEGKADVAKKVIDQFNAAKLTDERQLKSPRTADDAILKTITRKAGEDKKTFLVIHVRAMLDGNRIVVDTIDPAAQTKFEVLAEKAGLDLDVTVPPKLAALLENFKREEANPRGVDSDGNRTPRVKQLIFCDTLATHNKIKRLLIKRAGVSASQIAIITGSINNKPEDIIEVQNGFNAEGENNKYRVIIANEKAEVGVNLQKGTQAIHHLTIGWTPDSLTQRNGRGVRQGNKTERVTVYSYDADGTFDSYKRGMVGKKAGWIDSVMDVNGGDTVDIEVGLTREQAEALIDTVGDADAMTRFQEQLAAKEREARAATARAKQLVNLRTIDSSRAFIAENKGVEQWAAKKVLQYHGYANQAESLSERIANPKASAGFVLKAESTLADLRARMAGLARDVEEAMGLGLGSKTIADIRTAAVRRATRGKPVASDIVDVMGRYYLDLHPAESSALKDEWQSEIDQAAGMLAAAKAGFAKHAAGDGAIPESVVDAFVNGEAAILDGKPIIRGTIIETAKGVIHVVGGKADKLFTWQDGRLSSGTIGSIDGAFEAHVPGSIGYAVAADRAAAVEDAQIALRKDRDIGPYANDQFSAHSQDIADRRKVQSTTAFEAHSHELPAPCLPRPFKASAVGNSVVLKALHDLQSKYVIEADYRFMVPSDLNLRRGLGAARSDIAALRDFASAMGEQLSIDEVRRATSRTYEAPSTIFGLFAAGRNKDPISFSLTGSTEGELRTQAAAWVRAAAPGLTLTDSEAAGSLGWSDAQALESRIKSLAQPPQVPVSEAIATDPDPVSPSSIGDTDWVGIRGNTRQHKDVIKSMAEQMGGRAIWNGDARQWNVQYRAWKRLVEVRPELTNPGQLQLCEYIKK